MEICFRTKMTAYELCAYYVENKDFTSYMKLRRSFLRME